MLTARLKHLDSELTILKRELLEATTREIDKQTHITSLSKSLNESKKLIAQLEMDVESNVAPRKASFPAGSNIGSMELRELLSSDTERLNQQVSDHFTLILPSNNSNSENVLQSKEDKIVLPVVQAKTKEVIFNFSVFIEFFYTTYISIVIN